MKNKWNFLIYILSIQIFIPNSYPAVRKVKRMARNDQIRVQPKVSVNSKPLQISSRNVRQTPANIPVKTTTTIPVTGSPITYNAGKPLLFNNNNCKPTAAKTKSGNRDNVQTNGKPQRRNHTAPVSNKRHNPSIIVPHSGQNGKLSTTVANSSTSESYGDDAEELFKIISDFQTNSTDLVQIDSDKPINNYFTTVQENVQTHYNVTNAEILYSCKEFTITVMTPTVLPKNSTMLHRYNKKPYEECKEL